MKKLLTIAIALTLFSCSDDKTNYAEFKKAQDYNVPLFDNSIKNKTALLIFPHADDEIVCSGAIAQLKNSGWNVNLLTLTQGQPHEKDIRTKEWKNAVQELHIDNFQIMDLPNNSWENVMKNNIGFWYDNAEKIEQIVYNSIQKYKPSIVITYDSEIGGYGHPEHRMSAVAVNNVFQKHKTNPSFSVERILQITLSENLEQLMLSDLESYKNALKVTGNKSLPEPTVAFDISKNWGTKRNAALQYTSQSDILKKFYLLPEATDTIDHYKAFDREYYFEIKK